MVIPVVNERDAVEGLVAELEHALGHVGTYELIFVDDGSTDGTGELLERLESERDHVQLIRLARNFGKSAALDAGFSHSRGEVVVSIDGDGQDDPAEIPTLLTKLDEGFELVSGWKRDRQDPAQRRLASKLFNATTARISGVGLHDFNCGLKAYGGDQIRALRIYGELHRFIPVLGAQRGWRIAELPVTHRPRLHGQSNFGLERYFRGMLDLLAVTLMGRYQHRPLHLFGGFGLLTLIAGFVIGVYLTIEKIGGEAIGGRPLLLLGVLLMIVGIQFLTFGLLAQMVVAMRHERSAETAHLRPRRRPSPNRTPSR